MGVCVCFFFLLFEVKDKSELKLIESALKSDSLNSHNTSPLTLVEILKLY